MRWTLPRERATKNPQPSGWGFSLFVAQMSLRVKGIVLNLK